MKNLKNSNKGGCGCKLKSGGSLASDAVTRLISDKAYENMDYDQVNTLQGGNPIVNGLERTKQAFDTFVETLRYKRGGGSDVSSLKAIDGILRDHLSEQSYKEYSSYMGKGGSVKLAKMLDMAKVAKSFSGGMNKLLDNVTYEGASKIGQLLNDPSVLKSGVPISQKVKELVTTTLEEHKGGSFGKIMPDLAVFEKGLQGLLTQSTLDKIGIVAGGGKLKTGKNKNAKMIAKGGSVASDNVVGDIEDGVWKNMDSHFTNKVGGGLEMYNELFKDSKFTQYKLTPSDHNKHGGTSRSERRTRKIKPIKKGGATDDVTIQDPNLLLESIDRPAINNNAVNIETVDMLRLKDLLDLDGLSSYHESKVGDAFGEGHFQMLPSSIPPSTTTGQLGGKSKTKGKKLNKPTNVSRTIRA